MQYIVSSYWIGTGFLFLSIGTGEKIDKSYIKKIIVDYSFYGYYIPDRIMPMPLPRDFLFTVRQ